jgi:GNAT superfamily N-acetyltransferase
MLNQYPKEVTLRDGTKAILRPLNENDTEALFKFFNSLSKKARQFLYDDVTDRSVVEGWTKNINYNYVLPLLAVVNGEIAADATLHRREFGPLRHVGRIRIVVGDNYLGKGIATILTDELVNIAREGKLRIVSCMLAQNGEKEAIETLEALGFKKIAIIPLYMMDLDGNVDNVSMLIKNL